MNEIKKAIDILNDSSVVAIPTETVYGLAAKIDDSKALNKIFSIKERPFFDPLIVHTSSVEMLLPLVTDFNAIAKKLADAFWPGPLTMVLDKSDKVDDLITAGLDRVGLRIPNHPISLKLIKELGVPLAAPSANKFKKTSPTSSSHVKEEFGDEVHILEGGQSQVGIESTVLGVFDKEVHIYRPGMISLQEIQEALGDSVTVKYQQSPVAPGQLEHHYMPNRPLVIADESYVFNEESFAIWKLPSDPTSAARELYGQLRSLDKKQKEKILFLLDSSFKNDERWDGILNRLKKAKTEDYFF